MVRHQVDVTISAFNAGRTVGRAVRSSLAQDEARDVIVVDDASEDDTVQVATAEDDGTGRLHITTLPTNRGPASARNSAIARSTSLCLCFLDADDYFLP